MVGKGPPLHSASEFYLKQSQGMAERGSGIEVCLPAEVKEKLAELELELSEGDITQKGYEKKRAKLLARYIPLIQA
nr:PREDICTED: disco-interacting protein 2 homolog A [Latimeria chalumnae]|eukprot:XP_014344926.1 PREDICTED: disco-interacting protein 2 homolog A [Latimeria chalumnae]